MDSVVKAIGRVVLVGMFLLLPTFAADLRAPLIHEPFSSLKIVEAGVPVRFEVQATGVEPLYYRWNLRGTNLTSTNAWADVVFQNNEGSQDLLNVVVYNRYGNVFRQCVVKALNKPKITIEPTEVAVLSGNSFYLTVQGALTGVQWLKESGELPGETNYYLLRTNVTVADAGEYRVAGKNEIGTTLSEPITVRVLTTNSPPVVFDPPGELHMLSTETKWVDAKSVGFAVVESHRQDGSVSTADRFGRVEIEPEPGEFYFVARNNFGSSTSHVCKVVVHPPDATIILSGSSQTQTNLAEPGEPLNLHVDLLQGENVRYQWYFNDYYAIPGATSASLHVTDKFEPFQFDGRYELRATNELSAEVRRFEVRPNTKNWLSYPINGWAGENGDPVTLFANPNYFEASVQWHRNGLRIAGETNYMLQFTLSPETLGTYHVTMHGVEGDYISNSAEVIFRHMTNAARDYRLVADVAYDPITPGSPFPQPLMPVFGGIKGNIITLIIDGSLYRWSGALEKIVDRQTSLPPFRDGHWRVSSCSAVEKGVINFLVESDDGFPFSAVFERSGTGLKTIAQSGDFIAERPDVYIQTIQNVVRANGKIAMEILGMDAPIGSSSGYHGLHVWNGTNLKQWADSTNPMIEAFSLQSGVAFDGESIVIGARIGRYYDSGIYKITEGSIERLIGHYDRIPGLTARFGSPGGVDINNGKILFTASIDTGQGYNWLSLLEYSPTAQPKFRVVMKPGTTTDRGLSLARLHNAYMQDGAILFSAMAGGYMPPRYDTNALPFGAAAYGVFRERDGIISEELTSWDRVAGRGIGTQIVGVDGTNYVVIGALSLGYGTGFHTTLPGLPRPENTRVTVIDRRDGKFDALWNDGGRLQRSRDLVNWQDILATPGVVTNDFSRAAEYLRVYHP